jgi:hypothetical protein
MAWKIEIVTFYRQGLQRGLIMSSLGDNKKKGKAGNEHKKEGKETKVRTRSSEICLDLGGGVRKTKKEDNRTSYRKKKIKYST